MGGSFDKPSHHTSPSSVKATFVNKVFCFIDSIAFGFVSQDVPGATPKKPASGLIARSIPSSSGFNHAISSPTVETFQPFMESGATSIAIFVLPQALGNAPATYVFSPSGFSTPKINICSAIQPLSRAIQDAIRKAKHFLPNNAFPP